MSFIITLATALLVNQVAISVIDNKKEKIKKEKEKIKPVRDPDKMYYTEDGMCFTEEEYIDIQKSRRRSNWDLDDIPDREGHTPQYSDLGPEDDSYTPYFSRGQFSKRDQGGFGYSSNSDEDFIIKSTLG